MNTSNPNPRIEQNELYLIDKNDYRKLLPNIAITLRSIPQKDFRTNSFECGYIIHPDVMCTSIKINDNNQLLRPIPMYALYKRVLMSALNLKSKDVFSITLVNTGTLPLFIRDLKLVGFQSAD